jgi:hypothetical protein
MSDIENGKANGLSVGRLQSVLNRAAQKVESKAAAMSDIEVPKSKNGKQTGLSEGSQAHWFRKGEGGRRPGVPNKLSRIIKECVIQAAEEVGDLSGIQKKNLSKRGVHGPDGLTGYLRFIAKTERKAFVGLLGKLLPMQVVTDKHSETIYRSYSEVQVALGDHGLSIEVLERLKTMNVQPDDVENLQQNADVVKPDEGAVDE